MVYLDWQDGWDIGIAAMDAQHRQLGNIINDLHAALTAGESQTVLTTVLVRLQEYARTHFAAEEELLRRHGYPALAAQEQEHAAFNAYLAARQDDWRHNRPVMGVALLQYLRDWLLQHIERKDRAYVIFLRRHGEA